MVSGGTAVGLQAPLMFKKVETALSGVELSPLNHYVNVLLVLACFGHVDFTRLGVETVAQRSPMIRRNPFNCNPFSFNFQRWHQPPCKWLIFSRSAHSTVPSLQGVRFRFSPLAKGTEKCTLPHPSLRSRVQRDSRWKGSGYETINR
jgi:hypothetical protein